MRNYKAKIELHRSDLAEINKHLSFDEISAYSFKSASLSLEVLRKADLVTYIEDDGRVKELKNKYQMLS